MDGFNTSSLMSGTHYYVEIEVQYHNCAMHVKDSWLELLSLFGQLKLGQAILPTTSPLFSGFLNTQPPCAFLMTSQDDTGTPSIKGLAGSIRKGKNHWIGLELGLRVVHFVGYWLPFIADNHFWEPKFNSHLLMHIVFSSYSIVYEYYGSAICTPHKLWSTPDSGVLCIRNVINKRLRLSFVRRSLIGHWTIPP